MEHEIEHEIERNQTPSASKNRRNHGTAFRKWGTCPHFHTCRKAAIINYPLFYAQSSSPHLQHPASRAARPFWS